MKGYMGKILRINLSDGTISKEDLPESLIRDYIGGRGFGIKLLYDEVEAKIDPLSPSNKLIFTTGPLTGTVGQSCSRWIVTTKSPLTETYFRSVAGGSFGAAFKSAGYDIVIVEGKAEKPSFIWINGDDIEIRDAQKFVGMLTDEATAAIKNELNNEKAKVATVGPASEKFVLMSSIYDNRRLAARGGVGAVMWSKNLKAIAADGSKKVETANREKLLEVAKEHAKLLKENMQCQMWSKLGTSIGVDGTMQLGVFPVKNFQGGSYEEFKGILTSDITKQIITKSEGCHQCQIRCGREVHVKEGKFADSPAKGPEYEALYSFGGMTGCNDMGMIVEVNKICDLYGVDVISAGATISFAMELYEKGILTKDDTDGLDLSWGNNDAVYELMKKIVNREGIGDMLALGSRKAAEKIGKGAEKYAIQVKGLELPGYEPRGMKASGLNLATSAIGASHAFGQVSEEFYPPGTPGAIDRFSDDGKGAVCRKNQNGMTIMDTGVVCIFPSKLRMLDLPTVSEMISAATGIDTFKDQKEIDKIADRIWNLERAFNAREGLSRKNDTLPERFKNETIETGPIKGQTVNLDILLDDYYEVRGWDVATGLQKRSTLEKLDLQSVAEDLEKAGKLK